jgi:hypothetical protein
MKINLKSGVGELLFGMKENDVKALYGNPSRLFKDDDGNIIYIYNDKKLRLTFYQDEEFRLGYLIVSHPSAEIFGSKVIGEQWSVIEAAAKANGLKDFEKEAFDTIDNQFNEPNWIIFQVEFDTVIKIELGATINKDDEFDWKFKA